jgi:hypothetical protein
MFSGAQISLYPMSGNFVGIILGSLGALDPWRDRLRIETDDISTLIVGPPEILFPAMRDLFVAAARTGAHVTMHATVSRGCPGEPDDPICQPVEGAPGGGPLEARITSAKAGVAAAPITGQRIATQFSLYPLGLGHHMEEIYGCIEFLKQSGCFTRSKNFCTRLDGDAGPVFETLAQAFRTFGSAQGHVALDLTVSANSPSAA